MSDRPRTFGASILRRGKVADFNVISAVDTFVGCSSSIASGCAATVAAI